MKVIQFSFDNLLYITLYSISSFTQFKAIINIGLSSQLAFMFIESICLMLVVILEDISICMNAKISTKKIAGLDDGKFNFFIMKPDTHKQKRIKVGVVIALGALSALNSIILFLEICLKSVGWNTIYVSLNLLVTWLLMKIRKKWNMHCHQIVSFVLLLISIILIGLLYLAKRMIIVQTIIGSSWNLVGVYALIIVSISSREVIESYALEVLNIRQFRLLFYEGIGCFIISVLCLAILNLITCIRDDSAPLLSQYSFCETSKFTQLKAIIFFLFGFRSINSLYILLFFISSISFHIFRVILNTNQGPTHRYTGDLIAFALLIIIDSIIELFILVDDSLFDWGLLLIVLLQMLGNLIYNENIRLYFCDLAVNTKYEIERRASSNPLNGSDILELGVSF